MQLLCLRLFLITLLGIVYCCGDGNVSGSQQSSNCLKSPPVSIKSAKEIFEEGFKVYKQKKWSQAHVLFQEAWRVFNSTSSLSISQNINEAKILDFLQYTAYRVGRLDEALAISTRCINLPDIDENTKRRVTDWLSVYERKINAEKNDLDEEQPSEDQIKQANEFSQNPDYDHCHDETAEKTMAELSTNPKLFCRFDNRNMHPLLVLAPVKEEFVSVDPVIALFHDVITETEIDALKTNSNPDLHWSGFTPGNGAVASFKGRKAKVARLRNYSLPTLSRRIEAYTGLNPYGDAAEVYQISRYRIGGHFVAHYDSYANAKTGEIRGDRIATLLIYMSNVAKGGGTVFADLGVRITPQNGVGLFWYNFHKNQTYDYRHLHGGCPVLQGEKWVTTKWFRVGGQMLHSPTGLDPTSPRTMNDLSMPKYLQSISRQPEEFENPETQ